MPGPIQVAHASGLHAVARELARLHEEQLRQPGDAVERAVRLSVVTLVAVCVDPGLAEVAADAVAHLAASHPSRALIIVAGRDGPDSIEADISIREPRGSMRTEQVRLTVTGQPALHLASVVTPLLLPDVPVYLWMLGAPPLDQALRQDALSMCERLIIDSDAYPHPVQTLITLARELGPDADIAIDDIAWQRTRTWRELIAQSFDGAGLRRFVHAIERVRITVSGSRASAQSWLLTGWMAAQLGWSGDHGRDIALLPARVADVPDGEIISVRIDCVQDGARATVRVERHDDVLYTALDIDGTVSASRTTPAPAHDVVGLVGALLEEAGEDPVYRGAVRAAAELAPEDAA